MPFPRLGSSLSQPSAPANVDPPAAVVSVSLVEQTRVKDFKCPFCEWCGSTMGVVKTHIKKNTSKLPEESWPFCGNDFIKIM